MTARSIMARVAVAVGAGLLLCGIGAGPAIAAEPSTSFESVELKGDKAELTLATANLPADVTLGSAKVRVTADGVDLPARLTTQGREEASARSLRGVLILVDTSGSMQEDIDAARQAALDYARTLPTDVRAGLITFADRPRLVLKPTANRAALVDALVGLKAGGSTALYDAVKLGVSTLDDLGSTAQRRLVVLSDGQDFASTTSLDAATKLLSDEKVTANIVAFRYGSGDTSAVRQLAKANDGKVLTAEDSEQLSAAFTQMARHFTERSLVSVDVPGDLAGESALLRVTLTADGLTLTASQQVTFPSGLARWFAWWPEWSWLLWSIAGLIFVTAFLLALVLLGMGRSKDTGPSVLERIEQYGAQREATSGHRQEGSLARTAVGWTEDVLRSRGWEEKVAMRLDLAAIKLKPAEWTLLRLCACVVVSAVLVLLSVNFFLGVALGGLLGWVVTLLFVNLRISKRRKAFADQLPDVLQLLAGSLQSGFSLAQALDSVVREDTQPAAGEFSRALAESRIGVELETALDRIAERMASDDMRWIVMAIRIQREVGGNLAEVLLTTVATMRERAQTRRQVRALSAEGRLSAYILLALPVGIGALFYVISPEYMRPLHTTSIGIFMLAGAVIFMILGSFWMSRLIKVEV